MADETSKGLGQGLGIAAGLMSAPILVVVGIILVALASCGGCLILGLASGAA